MKKIEEEFVKDFDNSLGNQKSFEDIKDKINIGRFHNKKMSSNKVLYRISGIVAAFILLTAITIPTAIYFSSMSGAPSIGANIFDDENITIEFLREKDCLFYDNLVFAKDDQNHVFVTNDDKIIEHYKYAVVEFNESSYDNIYNKNIIDAVEYIGIPSYAGISSELSLDYSYNDGYIRRLKLTKNDDGLFINDVEVLDKENPETWFDPEKTDLPGIEQCEQISIGMSLDEVVRKIGKPQRDIGSGARLFQFDIDNGLALNIWFDLDVEKENEYVHNNPNVSVYGTHALYVGRFEIGEKRFHPFTNMKNFSI